MKRVNGFEKKLLHLSNLKEFLNRNAPHCPKCTTDQVQLMAYFRKEPEWRCRMCKLRFNFMPEGFKE